MYVYVNCRVDIYGLYVKLHNWKIKTEQKQNWEKKINEKKN